MKDHNQELRREIDDISNEHRLSRGYIKKKLVVWGIRTIVSAILYIIFRKHEWVRWTLVLYVPLSLFNLFMILRFNDMLDKRLNKLRARLD